MIISEPGEYQAKAPVDEIAHRTHQTPCSPDAALRFNSLSYLEIRHGFSAISRSCFMAVFKTARRQSLPLGRNVGSSGSPRSPFEA